MSTSGSENGEEPTFDPNKITLLPGAAHDAITFSIQDEDHTLGNALRYIIMKNPAVEFCGYSAPHPSEPKIHIRIQMYDHASAVEALLKGLDDLEGLTKEVMERYERVLAEGEFERVKVETVEERLEGIKRRKEEREMETR